jgi:CxxC motif-containing protein (DUF1111 family)
MRLSYIASYAVIALAALSPVGLRALSWRSASSAEVDPLMAQAGHKLFVHEWKPNDPLSRGGDGLGPVFNASSCVECHFQGGLGGAGGVRFNVTTFVNTHPLPGRPREGVVHSRAVRFAENLSHVDPSLPPLQQPALSQIVNIPNSGNHCITTPRHVHVSQRNTPALFGAKLIDEIPERVILANERLQQLKWAMASSNSETTPVGRAFRLPDGRIGRFGWKAQSPSLSEFVEAACANELGLSNPTHAQATPLSRPGYTSTHLDLTQEQCDQITSFVTSLPRPIEKLGDSTKSDSVAAGRRLFASAGCADCHTPNLGSVEGLYSDLLLHRMGQELQGGGSYNDIPRPFKPEDPDPSSETPHPGEWRTPPLWGVADSAPYLHDGRATTLETAIAMHRGQGAASAAQFGKLNASQQADLIAFLRSLRAPQEVVAQR